MTTCLIHRPATKWEELQTEVDQLPAARLEAWELFSRRGGNSHQPSSQVGEQVSVRCILSVTYASADVNLFRLSRRLSDEERQ